MCVIWTVGVFIYMAVGCSCFVMGLDISQFSHVLYTGVSNVLLGYGLMLYLWLGLHLYRFEPCRFIGLNHVLMYCVYLDVCVCDRL